MKSTNLTYRLVCLWWTAAGGLSYVSLTSCLCSFPDISVKQDCIRDLKTSTQQFFMQDTNVTSEVKKLHSLEFHLRFNGKSERIQNNFANIDKWHELHILTSYCSFSLSSFHLESIYPLHAEITK